MVDFGAAFASESLRLARKVQGGPNQAGFERMLQDVQSNCLTFLQTLLVHVEKRLPPVQSTFRGLSALHPSKILSQTFQVPFDQLPLQHLMSDRDILQNQYRRIGLHPWREESCFNGKIPGDAEEFWGKVVQFKRSDGTFPYEGLAKYALAALSVPVSNAVIERIFSHVTVVKNKYRNRMKLKMLDSILRVRLNCHLNKICCNKFEASKSMLEKFNEAMYIPENEILDISALEN